MNNFICFLNKFSKEQFTYSRRLVFKEKPAGDLPEGPAPQSPGQSDEPPPGLNFEQRAKWRATKFKEKAVKAASAAAKAVGQVGTDIAGIARETPETLRAYGIGAKEGLNVAGAFYVKQGAAAVETTGEVLSVAGRFYQEKAVAAWQSARPAAEILVGLGLMAKDTLQSLAMDAANFTAEKFASAVDWVKFRAEYVQNGIVNTAKVAQDIGKCAKVFWGEVAADTYAHAVATGRQFVRHGKEIYDITTAAGKELALAAGEKVKTTAKEALAMVSPVFETVVGLGLLGKDKLVAWGTDIGNWGSDQLNSAVNWSKFAARYVKDGVVDTGKFAYEFGIKVPHEFWGKMAADSYEAAIAHGQQFVRRGREIYYVTRDKVEEIAMDIKKVAIETGKATYAFVAPGVETIAGLGLLAKDEIAKFGRDVATWSVAQFNTVAEKAIFAARYVKNGVVDGAKVAYEFNIQEPAKFWAVLAADTYENAVQQGKRFVAAGTNIIDITTEKGRLLLARAKTRGQEALGTTNKPPAAIATASGIEVIAGSDQPALVDLRGRDIPGTGYAMPSPDSAALRNKIPEKPSRLPLAELTERFLDGLDNPSETRAAFYALIGVNPVQDPTGEKLIAGVKNLQMALNTETTVGPIVTVDGILGKRTLGVLERAVSAGELGEKQQLAQRFVSRREQEV